MSEKTETLARNGKKSAAAAPKRTGLAPLPAASTSQVVPAAAGAANLRVATADTIVTRGGKLQRVFAKVPLRMTRKEIYTIDDGKTWTISAEGYRTLNQAAGMAVIDAPNVPVDGRLMPNPYIIRNDKNQVTDIYVRKALIGRAHNGNIVVVSQTLHFNADAYFKRDLFNAIRMKTRWVENKPTESKEWKDEGRLVALSRFDRSVLKDHEALYELDAEVGLVVDLRSTAINDVLANRNENMIFGSRKAQSICERRLAQAHPGMPRPSITGDDVTVTREPNRYGKEKIVEAGVEVSILGWVELDFKAKQAPALIASAIAQGEEIASQGVDVAYHELDDKSASPDMAQEEVDPVHDAVNVGTTAAAAATVDAQASTDAEQSEAGPAAKPTKAALVAEIDGLIARLKKTKNGAAVTGTLIRECLSGECELVDEDEATLTTLRDRLFEAFAKAKKENGAAS